MITTQRKFSVNAKDLLDVLKVLKKVVSRNNHPATQNILVQFAKEDSNEDFQTIRLTATDLDVYVQCLVEIQLIEDIFEDFTVNIYDLHKIMSNISDPKSKHIDLTVNMESNHLLIRVNTLEHRLDIYPKADFPQPEWNVSDDFDIVYCDQFLPLLNRILISTPFTLQRLYNAPSAVLFTPDNDISRVVSTDGHRLSYAEVPMHLADTPTSVHRKTLDLLKQIIKSGKPQYKSNDILMASIPNENPNWHVFKFMCFGITIYSRACESRFPDANDVAYRRQSRRADRVDVVVDPSGIQDLSDYLQAVGSVKGEKGVECKITNGQMVVSALNSELNGKNGYSFSVTIPVRYEGKEIVIGFDANLLEPFVKEFNALKNQNMVLSIEDNESPVYIESGADSDWFFVLMPIRL